MKFKPFNIVCIFTILIISYPISALAGGSIKGIAQLELEDGSMTYADWVRVLLVYSKAEIPAIPDLDKMDKFRRMEHMRELHMKFFVNVRKKMTDSDYVFRSTLTKPEGTFQFSDIPPGSYYILVTFPAMIKDYKVAWQVPVVVTEGETISIKLNNDNLLIPTYSRR